MEKNNNTKTVEVKKIEVKTEFINGKYFYSGEIFNDLNWDTKLLKAELSGLKVEYLALGLLKHMSTDQTWSGMIREILRSYANEKTDQEVIKLSHPLVVELRKNLSGNLRKKSKNNKKLLEKKPLTMEDVISKLSEIKNPPILKEEKRGPKVSYTKPLKTYIWAALSLNKNWFDDCLQNKEMKGLKWYNCTAYMMNYPDEYKTLGLNDVLKQVTANMVKDRLPLMLFNDKILSHHKVNLGNGAFSEGTYDSFTYAAYKAHKLKSSVRMPDTIKAALFEGDLTEEHMAIRESGLSRRKIFSNKLVKPTNNNN